MRVRFATARSARPSISLGKSSSRGTGMNTIETGARRLRGYFFRRNFSNSAKFSYAKPRWRPFSTK